MLYDHLSFQLRETRAEIFKRQRGSTWISSAASGPFLEEGLQRHAYSAFARRPPVYSSEYRSLVSIAPPLSSPGGGGDTDA